MSNTINYINIEGLKFFGQVNASISHELKNILAIISETAGFLNDLTDLAKQGKELKLSLLEGCSQSIAEDIQRGFSTIKRMNQFAHSVDVPVKEIDLATTLELTVRLTQLLSYAAKVQIADHTKQIQSVLTSPFLLQNLIYQILTSAYKSMETQDKIDIEILSEDDGICLVFVHPDQTIWENFLTPKMKETADILGIVANLKTHSDFNLWIPYISDRIVALTKDLQIHPNG